MATRVAPLGRGARSTRGAGPRAGGEAAWEASPQPSGIGAPGRVLLGAGASPGAHLSALRQALTPELTSQLGCQDRAAVPASPLTRLPGFVHMQAGYQGATLSLWLLPPAPGPDSPLPTRLSSLLHPRSASPAGSSASLSQHLEFETGSSQIPGPKRLNLNHLGAENAYTPEVLDRGQNPES